MFTRQHYKAIAEIIGKRYKELQTGTSCLVFRESGICSCIEIADELADYFAKDNPRFDRDKFLLACGV